MAELLILEFEGRGVDDYHKVNGILGIDMSSDEGDWPKGLRTHIAGPTEKGLAVIEVWESKAEQEDFMHSRLGPALGQAGMPEPSRAEWAPLETHRNPRSTASV